MIEVLLTGGTGNQLFGWAYGQALKKSHDVMYNVKNYWSSARPFKLNQLGLDIPITWSSDLTQPVIDEGSFGFQPRLLDPPADCSIRGYFQSEKYFKACENEIRIELQNALLTRPRLPRTQELIEQIVGRRTCSIHIRRGDYLLPPYNKFHGVLDPAYYARAIRCINYTNAFEPTDFYVFSDDPEWCKSQFITLWPGFSMIVVDHTAGEHEDLLLMSLCKDAIVANSSFSWWGAWLRNWLKNPETRVTIAPDQWFLDKRMQDQTRDLIPVDWLRL